MSSRTFRVWAPRAETLALRIRGEDVAMSDPDYLGWYQVEADAEPGDNYFYVVDGWSGDRSECQNHAGLSRERRCEDAPTDVDHHI